MLKVDTRGMRLRRCCDIQCTELFTICISCDRGQRYCSDVCRKRSRNLQLRAAGRRYQATAAGNANHCERQRAYRRRQFRSVTHQGMAHGIVGRLVKYKSLSWCAICGGQNPWIMPLDLDARRRLIKKARF